MDPYDKPSIDELAHFGVLGMKWGVRRYQPYQKGDGQVGKGKYIGRKPVMLTAKRQIYADKKTLDRLNKGQRTSIGFTKKRQAAYNERDKKFLEKRIASNEKRIKDRADKKDAKRLVKDRKKWDKNVQQNWHKAYNKAANYTNNTLIPNLNKKYEKYDWSSLDFSGGNGPTGDAKLVSAYKKYEKEYNTKYQEVLSKSYDELFGKRPGS